MEADEDGIAAQWFQRIADSTTEHIYWPIPYIRSLYFLVKLYEELGENERAEGYYKRIVDYWRDGDIDREK